MQPHQDVEALLAGPTADGRSLRAWVDADIPPDAVIASVDGQATAYALGRGTVSILEAEYSETPWDEAHVRGLMHAYHADFLVVFPGLGPKRVPVEYESPFLLALMRGERPAWLALGAENRGVKIFRLAD